MNTFAHSACLGLGIAALSVPSAPEENMLENVSAAIAYDSDTELQVETTQECGAKVGEAAERSYAEAIAAVKSDLLALKLAHEEVSRSWKSAVLRGELHPEDFQMRINFFYDYIGYIAEAVEDGASESSELIVHLSNSLARWSQNFRADIETYRDFPAIAEKILAEAKGRFGESSEPREKKIHELIKEQIELAYSDYHSGKARDVRRGVNLARSAFDL